MEPSAQDDQTINALDALCNKGQVTMCQEAHPDVDLLNPVLRQQGWVSYANIEPFRSRRPYERSLWLRRPDGRCAPELWVLALLKFGLDVLQQGREPYWIDKDWTHSEMENVSVPQPAQPRKSRYGVKAGTPEYLKAYYSDPANKARQREHAKKHARRQRETVRAAQQVLKKDTTAVVDELRERILGPDMTHWDDDEKPRSSPYSEGETQVLEGEEDEFDAP